MSIEPVDTVAEVETPEQIRFRYRIAGPSRRSVAWVIDLLVRGQIMVSFSLLAGTAGITAGHGFEAVSTGVALLLLFLVEWVYFVLFEMLWSGRTLGKRAMQLRVVTENGLPLRFGDSLLRNLLRAADFLPFGYALGLVVMAGDRRFRRLGDLVAGTMVVIEDRGKVAPPVRIEPPPTRAEQDWLPERIAISSEERGAIEAFLRRAPDLSWTRLQELAELISPTFATRLGVRYRDPVRFLALVYCRTQASSRSR